MFQGCPPRPLMSVRFGAVFGVLCHRFWRGSHAVFDRVPAQIVAWIHQHSAFPASLQPAQNKTGRFSAFLASHLFSALAFRTLSQIFYSRFFSRRIINCLPILDSQTRGRSPTFFTARDSDQRRTPRPTVPRNLHLGCIQITSAECAHPIPSRLIPCQCQPVAPVVEPAGAAHRSCWRRGFASASSASPASPTLLVPSLLVWYFVEPTGRRLTVARSSRDMHLKTRRLAFCP